MEFEYWWLLGLPLFFGLGWLAARFFLALAWCAVAVKVGWQEGRHGGPAGKG